MSSQRQESQTDGPSDEVIASQVQQAAVQSPDHPPTVQPGSQGQQSAPDGGSTEPGNNISRPGKVRRLDRTQHARWTAQEEGALRAGLAK